MAGFQARVVFKIGKTPFELVLWVAGFDMAEVTPGKDHRASHIGQILSLVPSLDLPRLFLLSGSGQKR